MQSSITREVLLLFQHLIIIKFKDEKDFQSHSYNAFIAQTNSNICVPSNLLTNTQGHHEHTIVCAAVNFAFFNQAWGERPALSSIFFKILGRLPLTICLIGTESTIKQTTSGLFPLTVMKVWYLLCSIFRNQITHKQNEHTNHFLVSNSFVKDEYTVISNYYSER